VASNRLHRARARAGQATGAGGSRKAPAGSAGETIYLFPPRHRPSTL